MGRTRTPHTHSKSAAQLDSNFVFGFLARFDQTSGGGTQKPRK